MPGVFPPLSGNHVLSAQDPATLTGWKSVVAETRPRSFYTPNFARLSDAELAGVLKFAGEIWGAGRSQALSDDRESHSRPLSLSERSEKKCSDITHDRA